MVYPPNKFSKIRINRIESEIAKLVEEKNVRPIYEDVQ